MQRFARGRRDQLGVEGRVAIRDVRVDLEPRRLAIMRVETTGVASITWKSARCPRVGMSV